MTQVQIDALAKAIAEQEKAVQIAIEQARAEAVKESAAKVAELEEKIRAQAAQASPYRVRFGESLEGLKAAYSRMVSVVEEAEREDPAEGELLRKMISQVVSLLGA